MRTYDFAPLFLSTVDFDRLFDALHDNARSEWPSYNIEKHSENQYRISMAIAGVGPNEIELIQQANTLLVVGQKEAEQNNHEMLHQGLAYRSFRQKFSLADHVKVASANLENGLLSVELVREMHEELKPRRIEIGSSSPRLSGQDSQAFKLVDQKPERQTQAA
jgi:molecular chaperone IbpA